MNNGHNYGEQCSRNMGNDGSFELAKRKKKSANHMVAQQNREVSGTMKMIGLIEEQDMSPNRSWAENIKGLQEDELRGGQGIREERGQRQDLNVDMGNGNRAFVTLKPLGMNPAEYSNESFVPETGPLCLKTPPSKQKSKSEASRGKGRKGKGMGVTNLLKKRVIRKTKKSKKEKARNLSEECVVEVEGISISDGNIAHRNELNWREAEELWQIGSRAGVQFEGDKKEGLRKIAESNEK